MSRRARRERRGAAKLGSRARRARTVALVVAAGAVAALTLWAASRWRAPAAAPVPTREAAALRQVALDEHNRAWLGDGAARARSATRTSLERIVTEKRVLARLDSSAAVARTPDEWARARYWTGMVYENLGLTTDALRLYTEAHLRVPGATPALTHAAALMEYLRDPRPPLAPPATPAVPEPSRP